MSARLMQILASLAQRRALRTLDTICETQHQISTRKLGQYLEPIGDELAGHAFHLRMEYDALSSKIATLEAENDKLRAELERRASGDHTEQALVMVPAKPTQAMISAGWKVGLMGSFDKCMQAIAERDKLKSSLSDCHDLIRETNEARLEAEAERDTLRQQLAERDATIERLEAGIPRIQEQSHQMRQQRDKLAGLLLDARLKMGFMLYQERERLHREIDAALAEVGK